MSTAWYLYKNQQQEGPITWDYLVQKVETGDLEPADMVWTEGMENWARADQVEGLIVTAPPAPPPSPGVNAFQAPPTVASSFEPTGHHAMPGMAYSVAKQKTSMGLEQNVAGLLCYILGWISGIIIFLVESENKFVRFHAMQSIVTFGALTALQILIRIVVSLIWSILWRGLGSWTLAGTLTSLMGFLSTLIWLATVILAVLLMVKAYQNETFKLPIAGNIAEKQLL